MLHKRTYLQNRLPDTENRLVVAQGKRVVEERIDRLDEQMQAIIHSMDEQRAPTV